MYEDERLLSQEEKELMLEYRDLMYRVDEAGSFFLEYDVLPYLEANIRPPQEAIDLSLTLLAREGISEEELSKIEKQLSELPVRATTIEGNA